jgi:hypothetical protein
MNMTRQLLVTRQILVTAILASALAVLAAPSLAAAAPLASHQLAMTQAQSDSNLQWARRRVEENIDMLNNDRGDFGGFRAKAIALFQQAREQLMLGLKFDAGRENRPQPEGLSRPDAEMRVLRGDCASDVNLNVVRRNVERIIDVLQRDRSDYGGHRIKAIALLNQGRAMLRDAIAFDDNH